MMAYGKYVGDFIVLNTVVFEHYFSTCLILFRDDMKDLGAAPPNLPRNVPSRVVPSGVGARMAGKSEKRAFQW